MLSIGRNATSMSKNHLSHNTTERATSISSYTHSQVAAYRSRCSQSPSFLFTLFVPSYCEFSSLPSLRRHACFIYRDELAGGDAFRLRPAVLLATSSLLLPPRQAPELDDHGADVVVAAPRRRHLHQKRGGVAGRAPADRRGALGARAPA